MRFYEKLVVAYFFGPPCINLLFAENGSKHKSNKRTACATNNYSWFQVISRVIIEQ